MSKKFLIIFVDAYPYYIANASEIRKYFEYCIDLTPGFGYSVNNQAELFTGKSPDDIGFWCDWTKTRSPNNIIFRTIMSLLSASRASYSLERIGHKILNRLLNADTKHIPFHYLPYFKHNQYSVFDKSYPVTRFIDRSHTTVYSYRQFRKVKSAKHIDELVYGAGKKKILSGDFEILLLAFAELDYAGHYSGIGSSQYLEALQRTNNMIIDLVKCFDKLWPRMPVVVMSDHGMANVDMSFSISLEKHFGKPNNRKYIYFADATILRIWTEDNIMSKEIKDYILSRNEMDVVSSEERLLHGFASREFGNIVAICKQGIMIVPSFWGPRPSKGMHGYHPKYYEQRGVFLSNNIEIDEEISYNKDVFTILRKI